MPFLREELFDYIASIATRESSIVYEVGGVDDHVHVLLSLPRTMALSRLVEMVKKESSKWLKKRHMSLQLFSWQNGYGAFSVSASKIPVVRKYIRDQEEHHRRRGFEDELITFFKTANVPFDEKYLWN